VSGSRSFLPGLRTIRGTMVLYEGCAPSGVLPARKGSSSVFLSRQFLRGWSDCSQRPSSNRGRHRAGRDRHSISIRTPRPQLAPDKVRLCWGAVAGDPRNHGLHPPHAVTALSRQATQGRGCRFNLFVPAPRALPVPVSPVAFPVGNTLASP
jgi:hypothetical protein